MKKIGDLGELLVGRWLELQNHQLLEQNWRCRWGEIDLIAQDRATKAIAFVEVKTRSSRNWDSDGLLAIDLVKQQKLLQTASLFLSKYPHLAELPCRFDVALVSYHSRQNAISLSQFADITRLEIGQPLVIDSYELTLKQYLQAAFD